MTHATVDIASVRAEIGFGLTEPPLAPVPAESLMLTGMKHGRCTLFVQYMVRIL
jgi:hypothetical protein